MTAPGSVKGYRYRTPAYRSAIAHPYHVSTFADWSIDADGVTVGFLTEHDARAFAASRPEPLIDLVRRNDGMIAQRRMLAHSEGTFVPRDDFPQ